MLQSMHPLSIMVCTAGAGAVRLQDEQLCMCHHLPGCTCNVLFGPLSHAVLQARPYTVFALTNASQGCTAVLLGRGPSVVRYIYSCSEVLQV